jgi:hypothetical protein
MLEAIGIIVAALGFLAFLIVVGGAFEARADERWGQHRWGRRITD